MNPISEQLLQAMDVMMDNKVSQLKYDKTIQGEITKVVNLDSGEYKFRYNNNIFSVFASDVTQTYEVGDEVFVTVPEGDFSNKKIIVGAVTGASLGAAQQTELKNVIVEVSPEFETLCNCTIPDSNWGLVAGKGQPMTLMTGAGAPNQEAFRQYGSQYEYIQISADFRTELESTHTKGNYGLRVTFEAEDATKAGKLDTVEYRLDLDDFNGDPYRFNDWTPQSIVVQAQKGYLTRLVSVDFFEENFDYDMVYVDGENGIDLKPNTETPNLFVQNLSLKFVEKQDLTDTNYYLIIDTPNGVNYDPDSGDFQLDARVLYKGQDIKSDETCEYHWFERDLSVLVDNSDIRYSPLAGAGWCEIYKPGYPKTYVQNTDQTAEERVQAKKELEEENEANREKSSSLDFANFKPKFQYSQQYKLVVIYNERTTLSKEIEIYNSHGQTYKDCKIEQEIQEIDGQRQGHTHLFLSPKGQYHGNWYIEFSDGAYQPFKDGIAKSDIDITEHLTYSSITFHCAVSNNEGFIRNLKYQIINSESREDVTIDYIGSDYFHYDANGDITIEDAEKDKNLQAKVTWFDGYAASYELWWGYKEKNGEIKFLSDMRQNGGSVPKEVDPPDSMMTKLWVDQNNILHYNIRQKYWSNYSNNTIVVQLRTITGQIYTFEKEIMFVKDGDQGTNGSTYTIAIIPVYSESNTAKKTGLQGLVYKNNDTTFLRLRCFVYKNGIDISGDSTYICKYDWEPVHVVLNNNADKKTREIVITGVEGLATKDAIIQRVKDIQPLLTKKPLSAEEQKTLSSLQTYVKIEVKITDTINNKDTYIYASYPINLIINMDAPSNKDHDSKYDFTTIPNAIRYTASGVNASFYNSDIQAKYGEESAEIQSLNPMVLEVEDIDPKNDNIYRLKPSQFYNAATINPKQSNIGLLQCKFDDNRMIIHPIIMYLDTYGNEAINGWDGEKLKIDEEGHYLFAPQIGAGKKNTNNQFTGVVMGQDSAQTDNGDIEGQIGLYGYRDGVTTFGLKTDGTAFFGAQSTGGQIRLDGYAGIIAGGGVTVNGDNVTSASNGMYIRLANKNTDGNNTKAIGVGRISEQDATENFYVRYDGHMFAIEGKIGGTDHDKYGWTIKHGQLYSGTGDSYVALNSEPEEKQTYAFWAGKEDPTRAFFSVTKSGILKAKSGDFQGKITSTEGMIAGWTIDIGRLYSGSGSNHVELNSSASTSTVFWAGAVDSDQAPFQVTKTGHLRCSQVDIRGTCIANLFTIQDNKNNEYGTVGIIQGSKPNPEPEPGEPDTIITYNLGIRATSLRGIVLESNGSIRLSGYNQTDANGVFIHTTGISITGTTAANTTYAFTAGYQTDKFVSTAIQGMITEQYGGCITLRGGSVYLGLYDSDVHNQEYLKIYYDSTDENVYMKCSVKPQYQIGIYARFA